MSFCTKCGNQLADDVSFCGKCGTSVKAASQGLNVSFSNETTKKSKKQIDDGESPKGETHIVPHKNIEIYIAGSRIKGEHGHAFIETTKTCFKDLMNIKTETEIGRFYFYKRNMDNPTAIMDIAVFVKLAGDFEYRVLFEMSRETALDLASSMLLEKCTDFNNIVKDAVQELFTIITSQLCNFGLNSKPSHIELFTDSNIDLVTTLGSDNILVIPIKFE